MGKSKICNTITIAATGVVDILSTANQKNYFCLRDPERIYGMVFTIQTATVAAGFTGGGAGVLKVEESADGTNWSDVTSANVTLAAADTTYTIRINGTVLPLKSYLRLYFTHDSGNYIVNIYLNRLFVK